MSTATAIFLSATLLSVVLLYGFTRERWRWRRIVLTCAASCGLLLGCLAAGRYWLATRTRADARERVADQRRKHEVRIGEHLSHVLQRQGVPDTLVWIEGRLVAAYWDADKALADVEKAFFFSLDSTLVEIRYLGGALTEVEYGWMPTDGIELGATAERVSAALGAPCRKEVGEARTVLEFATDTPGVLRYVSLLHGAQIVVRHGWIRGECPAPKP
jgi:hypothetical protein